MRNSAILKCCYFLGLALILSACGSSARSELQVESIALTSNPGEEVALLFKELNIAASQDMRVLSPNWFAKAEETSQKAKKSYEAGESNREIFSSVALARAQLKEANRNGRVARTALPQAIEARGLALKAGAGPQTSGFEQAENSLSALAKLIESNQLQEAQEGEDTVVQLYRDVELDAIKERYLGKTYEVLHQAELLGGDKSLPKVFNMAQSSLDEAEQYIDKARYEEKQIGRLSAEAQFQAYRILNMTRFSQRVESETVEELALWLESELAALAKEAKLSQGQDVDFETQFERIQAGIQSLVSAEMKMAQNESQMKARSLGLEKRIANLEEDSKTSQQKILRLKKEQVFNERFERARNMFTDVEADCYRKGDRLVIRLKDLKFPISKSVLLTDNYALLEKVKSAMATLGRPEEILIEGHTDSTGSEALNKKLSIERASAVRDYFAATSDYEKSSFRVLGKGSSQPLESNETAKGRATNRRVDIILNAEKLIEAGG